ncbi:MAG TPA: GNVR domain-containing protein, partial [Dongiaceae bacterium]|nr:GNVR domain-containing protein [Dongiaceae bacterium]
MRSLSPLPSSTPVFSIATTEPVAPSANAGAPSELSEILRKIWRKKALILASIFAVAAVAGALTSQLTPLYEASTQLIVGVPPDRVSTIESVVAELSPDNATVQNEAYQLQSRDLAAQVVGRLGLDKDPEFNSALRVPTAWQTFRANAKEYVKRLVRSVLPQSQTEQSGAADPAAAADRQRQRIISTLLAKIDITPQGRSHVLSIDVETENPTTAAAIGNTLAQVYIDDQRRQNLEATRGATSYLDSQIEGLRQQVIADEKAVEDYRRQTGLYEGESSSVSAQQLTELNTQLMVAETAKTEVGSRLQQAQSLLQSSDASDTAPAVIASPLVQALKQQLATAEAKQAELAASLGAKHPTTRNARAEIANIKQKIQLEIGKIIDGLRNEARTANANYEALRKSFERLKSETGETNERQVKLRALEREANASRTLFENLLSRSKETNAQEGIQQPDARIVSMAVVPESPSFPPKALLLMIGALAGTLLGVLLTFLVEHLDQSFRRADQVEELTGLPMMAMVPVLRRRLPAGRQILDQPYSPYREALRKLQAALLFSNPAKTPRVVMVASAAPREGKSSLCYALARLLAKSGRRVVVVDCDWRRPQLHRLFGQSNKTGIVDLLRGEATLADILHQDPATGTAAIFAGKRRGDLAYLSGSEQMGRLFRTLADEYDFVLVDTPPVLVGAEVLHLAHLVDKTVFVVRWGHTHREAVLNALRQLIDVRGEVAGIVLSRVNPRRYR